MDSKMDTVYRAIPLILLFAAAVTPVSAQNGTRPAGLRLFLDCDRRDTCDREYIRTEIDYVDYVRDRTESDVHLLITTEGTASGGRSYTLAFLGQKRFRAVSDTLTFSTLGTDTGNERREALVHMIAVGLTPFLARTALAGRLRVEIDRDGVETERPVDTEDPWNYWVFDLGISGSFDGEESQKSYYTRGNVSANRTTEDWKVRLSTRADFREERYELDSTTVTSTNRNGNIFGFVARSLGPHWSLGGSGNANTSSRENTDYAVSAGPAVEYNIFPYSESTRRELRLQYSVDLQYVTYDEETVYDRLEETLLSHAFETRLDLNQPWGGAGGSIEIRHYLTNFELSRTKFYSVEIDGRISFRVVRGLNVRFEANVEFIHDQLYLSKEEISDEDILLGRIRLPTSYEYGFQVGVSYSFGSIYNNVVNPRFGF